jgi:hypothetical protein
MRRYFVRLGVLLTLVLTALGVSSTAPAQSKVTEVVIGSVLPLTGTFASYGQQYLWSAQTAEDIVNNDYPDLNVPLGPARDSLGSAVPPSSSSCVTTRVAALRPALSTIDYQRVLVPLGDRWDDG